MPVEKEDPHCPVNSNAGTVLYSLRLYRGLSHAEVAKALGVSVEQLQKYEAGSDRMPISVLFNLARFFKVSVMDFFAGLDVAASPADHLWLSRDELKILRLWRNLPDDPIRKHIVQFMQELGRYELSPGKERKA
ncbi:MAG: helix-turn-helix domain-containing protein [Micavibrio sp.]